MKLLEFLINTNRLNINNCYVNSSGELLDIKSEITSELDIIPLIFWIAQKGSFEVMKFLITKGININGINYNNQTLLHTFITQITCIPVFQNDLKIAGFQNDLEIANLLIDNGAECHILDDEEESILDKLIILIKLDKKILIDIDLIEDIIKLVYRLLEKNVIINKPQIQYLKNIIKKYNHTNLLVYNSKLSYIQLYENLVILYNNMYNSNNFDELYNNMSITNQFILNDDWTRELLSYIPPSQPCNSYLFDDD